MQKWLSGNDVLMYSTYNESKSAVPEIFIRTLNCKIYKKIRANEYIANSIS